MGIRWWHCVSSPEGDILERNTVMVRGAYPMRDVSCEGKNRESRSVQDPQEWHQLEAQCHYLNKSFHIEKIRLHNCPRTYNVTHSILIWFFPTGAASQIGHWSSHVPSWTQKGSELHMWAVPTAGEYKKINENKNSRNQSAQNRKLKHCPIWGAAGSMQLL